MGLYRHHYHDLIKIRDMKPQTDTDSPFVGDYAQDFKTWSEFYDSQPELALLDKHAEWEDDDVLEAGCGSGRLSFRVDNDPGSLVGVDIVPSLVELCHNQLTQKYEGDPSRMRFEVQNLENLPYPDSHFDTILDGWTFTTLDDFDAGAAEYKRVLSNDGVILAIEVREASPYQQILEEFIPDDKYEDYLPPSDKLMRDAFGEPELMEDIVSSYRFESLEEAFQAFMFNFVEWMEIELTENEQAQLKDRIRNYQTADGVIIDEYARFFKIPIE